MRIPSDENRGDFLVRFIGPEPIYNYDILGGQWTEFTPTNPEDGFTYYDLGFDGIPSHSYSTIQVWSTVHATDFVGNLGAGIVKEETLDRSVLDLFAESDSRLNFLSDVTKDLLRGTTSDDAQKITAAARIALSISQTGDPSETDLTAAAWSAELTRPDNVSWWPTYDDPNTHGDNLVYRRVLVRLAETEDLNNFFLRISSPRDDLDETPLTADTPLSHLGTFTPNNPEDGFIYREAHSIGRRTLKIELFSYAHATTYVGNLGDGIVSFASLASEVLERLADTPLQPSVASQTNQGANAWVSVATQEVVVKAGQKIMFWCSSSVEHETNDAAVFDSRLVRDNQQILFENRAAVGKGQIVMNFIDSPNAGTYTYKFDLRCSVQGGNFVHPSMMILPVG